MCRSFLLFRGALMNKEWIEDWREEVGLKKYNGGMKYIPLHGSTSTSKNLDVALGFSKCDQVFEANQQPVLIVTSI